MVLVDFQLEWATPVFVREGDRDDRCIRGPREALRYLHHDFPTPSGQSYWVALEACHSAMLHRSDPEGARDRFIATYAEYLARASAY